MRITVTGASGFLGAWVVRALAASGHVTSAVVRSEDPWRLRGARGVSIVYGEPSEWPQLAAATSPDVLVMLDWEGVDARFRDDAVVQRSNLTRWAEIVEASLSAGATRIIGLGSQAEFGPRRDTINDDDAPAPVIAYGRVKVEAAELLSRLAHEAGASSVWARVFSVYGPLDNENVLLAQIRDAMDAGRAIPLSSARQEWSYLYAADAARALALLAVHPDAPERCNVAHPDSPPLRHIVDAFAATLDGVQLEYGAVPDSASGAQLRASTARLHALGWSPTTSLLEGLDRTSTWLRGDAVPDPFGTAPLPARAPRALS